MTPPKHQANPLFELLLTIVVPALILMKLSGPERLGSVNALLLALAFPIGWGLWEGARHRRISAFAVLGLVSTLLTGGIGLFELDTRWLAIKEAAVPGLIGLAVLVSTRTRWPLIRTLVYNPALIDVARVEQRLAARGHSAAFEARLQTATYALAASFFFSSAMNYLLARWIVTSPAGSEAFNQELGRMTLLSYPVIALPSMAMLLAILWYLIHGAKALTGLSLGELTHQPEDAPQRPGA